MTKPSQPIRNFAARSPLLRKGGVHQASRSAQRHSQRQQLNDAVDAWWEERVDCETIEIAETAPQRTVSDGSFSLPWRALRFMPRPLFNFVHAHKL